MAYKRISPQPVTEGGTGAQTFTTHGVLVGEGTSAITALTAGTNGQVLLGGNSTDPSFVTPTAGTGLSITTNATTLSYALSTPVSIANGGTNATSFSTTDGTVYYDGTRLVTTATGTSGQVLTSNGAGVAPTFQAASAGGTTWSVITANQTAAVNNGYICNKAGTLALALPASATVGSIIEVTGINTATGWQITQGAGQQIFFGNTSTTLGATGTLTSTAIRDSLRMVCVVADTTWNVLSSIGNITVV